MLLDIAIYVMVALVGLAAGSYTTSMIYRLPRGIRWVNDPPFCDHCHTYLEERDKFPLISWLVNGCKCRFCGVAVTSQYALVEGGMMLLFILGYSVLGIGEAFIILMLISAFVLIALVHQYNEHRFIPVIMVALIGSICCWRLFQDHTLMSALAGTYIAMFVAIIIWQVKFKPRTRKQKKPAGVAHHASSAAESVAPEQAPLRIPSLILSASICGMCFAEHWLLVPLCLLGWPVFYGVLKQKRADMALHMALLLGGLSWLFVEIVLISHIQ